MATATIGDRPIPSCKDLCIPPGNCADRYRTLPWDTLVARPHNPVHISTACEYGLNPNMPGTSLLLPGLLWKYGNIGTAAKHTACSNNPATIRRLYALSGTNIIPTEQRNDETKYTRTM